MALLIDRAILQFKGYCGPGHTGVGGHGEIQHSCLFGFCCLNWITYCQSLLGLIWLLQWSPEARTSTLKQNDNRNLSFLELRCGRPEVWCACSRWPQGASRLWLKICISGNVSVLLGEPAIPLADLDLDWGGSPSHSRVKFISPVTGFLF